MVTASAGALNFPSSPHSVISLEFHPCLAEGCLNNLFGRYHKPTPGAVGSARVKEAAAGMTSRAGPLLQPGEHLAVEMGVGNVGGGGARTCASPPSEAL